MIDLTARDLDILETLTRRVRLVSIDRIRRIWWSRQATCRNARRRFRQLARAGFVQRRIVNVDSPIEVRVPLAAWRRGMPSPDPLAVSRADRKRWHGTAMPTELFTATRRTANLFGSSAVGLPKLFQRDQSLLLAEVYVLYRTTRPELAQDWLGEDALCKGGYRIKAPDAFLVDDCGKPYRVIKAGGLYAPRRIEAFHEQCVLDDLSHELW